MTISGLTKGRVFGESQIARYRLFPAPAGPSPAPEGGFRVSGLLDLRAESQITATPRHSAPGAGACQPAQRSGHQGNGWFGPLPEACARPEVLTSHQFVFSTSAKKRDNSGPSSGG